MKTIIFVVFIVLGLFGSVVNQKIPKRNSIECYDCNYGLINQLDGKSKPGFDKCSFNDNKDGGFLKTSKCVTGMCFIRKDSNNMIYRGCADLPLLPWLVNREVQCAHQGGSFFYFCEGNLCNSGDLTSKCLSLSVAPVAQAVKIDQPDLPANEDSDEAPGRSYTAVEPMKSVQEDDNTAVENVRKPITVFEESSKSLDHSERNDANKKSAVENAKERPEFKIINHYPKSHKLYKSVDIQDHSGKTIQTQATDVKSQDAKSHGTSRKTVGEDGEKSQKIDKKSHDTNSVKSLDDSSKSHVAENKDNDQVKSSHSEQNSLPIVPNEQSVPLEALRVAEMYRNIMRSQYKSHFAIPESSKSEHQQASSATEFKDDTGHVKSVHGGHEITSSNPCSTDCRWQVTSQMHADPADPDSFIKCGPGVQDGRIQCSCCKPYHFRCPRGTSFDAQKHSCGINKK